MSLIEILIFSRRNLIIRLFTTLLCCFNFNEVCEKFLIILRLSTFKFSLHSRKLEYRGIFFHSRKFPNYPVDTEFGDQK